MDAITFAHTVRQLNTAAVRRHLEPAGFRSPPQDPAVTRSLRFRDNGMGVVAVRIAEREDQAVLEDMVDGLLAANHAADVELRAELLAELG